MNIRDQARYKLAEAVKAIQAKANKNLTPPSHMAFFIDERHTFSPQTVFVVSDSDNCSFGVELREITKNSSVELQRLLLCRLQMMYCVQADKAKETIEKLDKIHP